MQRGHVVTISADDRRTGSQILATAGDRYSVVLTRDRADIRAAQRLRHDAFTGEFGARLTTTLPGLGRRRLRPVVRPPRRP
jgi:putative hemolysin